MSCIVLFVGPTDVEARLGQFSGYQFESLDETMLLEGVKYEIAIASTEMPFIYTWNWKGQRVTEMYSRSWKSRPNFHHQLNSLEKMMLRKSIWTLNFQLYVAWKKVSFSFTRKWFMLEKAFECYQWTGKRKKKCRKLQPTLLLQQKMHVILVNKTLQLFKFSSKNILIFIHAHSNARIYDLDI